MGPSGWVHVQLFPTFCYCAQPCWEHPHPCVHVNMFSSLTWTRWAMWQLHVLMAFGIMKLFSEVLAPFHIPVPPHPAKTCCFPFPVTTFLMGTWLRFWLLVTGEAKCFFMCFSHLCIFFVQMDIRIFCPSFHWVVFLWLSCNYLNILMHIPYQVHDLKIFFPSMGHLFTFLMVSSEAQFFHLSAVHFAYLFFSHLCFWCHIWESSV